MKWIRILYLAEDVTPGAQGGDTTHVREVVKRLARQHSVCLVARKNPPSVPESGELAELRGSKNLELRLLSLGRMVSMSSLRGLATSMHGLRSLRRGRPDLIYSRTPGSWADASLSRLTGVPLVMEINGEPVDEREMQGRLGTDRRRRKVKRRYLKQLERASLVVCVSEALRKQINEVYGVPLEKLVAVENGVDVEMFKPMDKADARERLGLAPGDRIIGYVGNITPWHGLEEMAAVAKAMKDRGAGVKFAVIGSDGNGRLGRLARELRVEDVVLFLGRKPHREVPGCIAAFDACWGVLTKQKKSGLCSPVKMYEYLACGRPVIANEYFAATIGKERCGVLVDEREAEGAADAILRLLDDVDAAEEMGRRGRDFVVRERSWDSVAERVEDICRTAASR